MILKDALKKLIHHHPIYEVNQIIKKIEAYSCVSFDVFDTLIKRSVPEPQDVFFVAARRLNEKKGMGLDEEAFKSARVAAEEAARLDAMKAGRYEVSLGDIYAKLSEPYATLREMLIAEEVAAEKSCCHANPVLLKVFQWCVEQQKRVIIISDMYLPLEVIRSILEECGYRKYEKLYVSSAVGRTKGDGSLFEYVLQDRKIEKGNLIHIGDSLRGDYMQAKKHGIAALRIARNPKRTQFYRPHTMPYSTRRQFKYFAAIMNHYIDPVWDIYYQFGFEVLGPILYGFCIWLHKEVKAKCIDHIFFFSRDGYMMQKGYQLLFGNDCVENTYLYVSRRALYIPQFWIEPGFHKFLELYSGDYERWNCEVLCEKLGISIENGRKAWDACGLPEKIYLKNTDIEQTAKVEQFYKLVLLQP